MDLVRLAAEPLIETERRGVPRNVLIELVDDKGADYVLNFEAISARLSLYIPLVCRADNDVAA